MKGVRLKRTVLKRATAALIVASLLTALGASGLLYRADTALSDALYQAPQAQSGAVVVVGVDQRALEALGPWPWSREVLAKAIESLNAEEDSRPAVIGVDALFVGETDPAADERLAQAAKACGNVVTATAATFGAALVSQADGGFHMDDYAVLAYDQPYLALREGTAQGHINAMLDRDGMLRHSLLWVDVSGQRMYSFAWTIYQKYQMFKGEAPLAPPPTDARGFWYLPFTALPGGFDEGVSILDVLNGDIPRDRLAGRIVLIGPYAAGLQDAYPTAIDRAQNMYGVEVQANAIEALLNGRFQTEIADLPQLGILLAVCFFTQLFFWDRKVLAATVGWLIAAGGWLGLCKLAYGAGAVLHPLWIPLGVTLLYVASVGVNYARSLAEKRRITNTFKRYVDPTILGELLKEDSEALGLGGKQCDIAVLFVDIRGFTTLSEGLSPGEVVEILNQYLSLTTDCVMRNHGTLDKFVGDCTMAIWNAPLQQADYVMLAVRAALDMVEGSKALDEALFERWGRKVSFGVGVHTGPAVVGNIGAQMRMDFTAIGDTVNTASRLESNAPPGKIYISRAVADALAGRLRTTSLGDTVKLKGKAAGFEVLELEGLVAEEQRQMNEGGAHEHPFS